MAKEALVKIVKPLAKGQITIPVKFRESLGIDEDTHLKLTLKEKGFFGEPLKIKSKPEGMKVASRAAKLAAIKSISSLNLPVSSWRKVERTISEAHSPHL